MWQSNISALAKILSSNICSQISLIRNTFKSEFEIRFYEMRAKVIFHRSRLMYFKSVAQLGHKQGTGPKMQFWGKCQNGAPERIRTSGLSLRRAALYPAELRARHKRLF